MKGPKEDQTSLGNILMEWEIITPTQLERALKDQATLRGDVLLGKLLVAGGACTCEEIDMAMSAQAKLRAGGKIKRAMVVADIALARHCRDSVLERRDRILEKGEVVRKYITGEGHVAISAAMLAKPTNS